MKIEKEGEEEAAAGEEMTERKTEQRRDRENEGGAKMTGIKKSINRRKVIMYSYKVITFPH